MSLKQFIQENKYYLLILLAITLAGGYLRTHNTIFGDNIINFSGDETCHIFSWGGVYSDGETIHISNNLKKIFFFSYVDAHPGLSNIIVNLVVKFCSLGVYAVRLISIIPGILLIPLSYLIGYLSFENSSNSSKNFNGLTLASITALMSEMVITSFENRPYAPMLLFLYIAILSFILFQRKKEYLWLSVFTITAILALSTTYNAAFVLFFASAAIFFHCFGTSMKPSKKIWIGISMTLIALTTFFHLYNVKKSGRLNDYTKANQQHLEYISMNYIHDSKQIPQRTFDFFKIFSSNYQKPFNKISNFIFFLAYCFGLIILIQRRSWDLLLISFAPFLFNVALGYLKLFPFIGNRHCIVLIPCVLIAYGALLDFILKIKPLIFKLFVCLLITVSYFMSLNIYNNDHYLNRFKDPVNMFSFHNITREEFREIKLVLAKESSKNKFTVFDPYTGFIFNQHIALENLDFQMRKVENPHKVVFRDKKEFCYKYEYMNVEPCTTLVENKDKLQFKSLILTTYNHPLQRQAQEKYLSLLKNLGYKRVISKQQRGNWALIEISK